MAYPVAQKAPPEVRAPQTEKALAEYFFMTKLRDGIGGFRGIPKEEMQRLEEHVLPTVKKALGKIDDRTTVELAKGIIPLMADFETYEQRAVFLQVFEFAVTNLGDEPVQIKAIMRHIAPRCKGGREKAVEDGIKAVVHLKKKIAAGLAEGEAGAAGET